MTTIDPVDLTKRLIACNSVTPADGGAQDVLADALTAIGFDVHRMTMGEAPHGPVQNLFATRGSGDPPPAGPPPRADRHDLSFDATAELEGAV